MPPSFQSALKELLEGFYDTVIGLVLDPEVNPVGQAPNSSDDAKE